jgi:hypothetical protein
LFQMGFKRLRHSFKPLCEKGLLNFEVDVKNSRSFDIKPKPVLTIGYSDLIESPKLVQKEWEAWLSIHSSWRGHGFKLLA